MSDRSRQLFIYNLQPHKRRHGPRGYESYKSFKPWLRDEFQFRCVFCLYRERWTPDGEAAFCVEHFQPQTSDPALVCDYHNLFLACCGCNSTKRDVKIRLNPCEMAIGKHLEVANDGTIFGLTSEGKELLQVCHMNRPKLKEYRERMIQLWQELSPSDGDLPSALCIRFFGYPDNLPDLTQNKPAGGNAIAKSEEKCYFKLSKRGKLDYIY